MLNHINFELMENKDLARTVKHWYLPLIMGIVLIIMGLWVFATPVTSYIALSIIFAVTFFVTGILEIIHALGNRREIDQWGWSLAGGVLDLILGILLLSQVEVSMLVLAFVVGFGVLFRSIFAIGHAIESKKRQYGPWGYLLFLGILGLIFSFIMIWNPLFAGLTIVFYTGMAFIMVGIFQIVLSLGLGKLKKRS